MVSMEDGVSTAYALNNIQARGKLFVGPQEEIYAGMIVGENARPEDLPVNPCKAKNLTNMRSQGDGKGIQLEAPLEDDPRTRDRVHRLGRIRRGDAEVIAATQAHPRRQRAEARGQRGRRVTSFARCVRVSASDCVTNLLQGRTAGAPRIDNSARCGWILPVVRQPLLRLRGRFGSDSFATAGPCSDCL